MYSHASVLYNVGDPLKIERVILHAPKDDEVLVKIIATSICLSDLHVMDGSMSVPLPVVLGHEGAGIVEDCGKNISHVKIGDSVMLSWAPECKSCRFCMRGLPHLCQTSAPRVLEGTLLDGSTRLSRENGDIIHHYSFLSTWSEYSVVSGASCIPIPEGIDFDPAALVGCAVMTGIGAAMNTAKVQPGSVVAVYGIGGVGLNVLQGSRLCGAREILAIDTNPNKESASYSFGATKFINPRETKVMEVVNDLTEGFGADYVFDAVGHPIILQDAYEITARRGTLVCIGIASDEAYLQISAKRIPREEKIITGSFYGSSHPQLDFKNILEFYRQGRIKLDELISRKISLEEINYGCQEAIKGNALRILVHPHNQF